MHKIEYKYILSSVDSETPNRMGWNNRRVNSLWFIRFIIVLFVQSRTLTLRQKTQVLRVFKDSDCLYTYTAVQPNLDVITEKVAEFTIDKCAHAKRKQQERMEKQKLRKKKIRRGKTAMRRKRVLTKRKQSAKNTKQKVPRTKSRGGRKVRPTKRRNKQRKKLRKMFVLQEEFTKWKTSRPVSRRKKSRGKKIQQHPMPKHALH